MASVSIGRRSSKLLKSLWLLAVASSAFVLAGNEACREDYDFGSRSRLVGTPSPTPESEDNDDDDGTITQTPTSTPDATVMPTATASPTPTVNPSGTPTGTPTGVVATASPAPGESAIPESSLITLSAVRSALEQVAEEASFGVKARLKTDSVENWLGQAYTNTTGWIDSDGDGFSDSVESREGSDPNQADSVPHVWRTQVQERMRAFDNDWDGQADAREAEVGTSIDLADSDGDGCRDGLEVLSGSDPSSPDVIASDADRDCLSDSFELERGFLTDNPDSDGDGLQDGWEVIFATDALSVDSDGDGISDGKELELGSDPLIPEFLG